jgi:hypothetical protein
MPPLATRMAHNHFMAMTTRSPSEAGTRWRHAVPVGIALIVAELLLAALWYPWVVEHLVLGSSLPFEALRLLIVAPEYVLVAVAVYLVARSPALRLPAAGLALLAGLMSWGFSVLASHIAGTITDLAAHQQLLDTISWVTIVAIPALGALAWGVARRQGGLWLLAVPLAPALHWWLQHGDWTFRLGLRFGFRGSEVVGMAFVIIPVLLAILAGWALEQVQAGGSATT